MHNNEIAYAGAAIQSATMFSCMRPAAIVKHSITQLCREQRSNRKPVTKECLPIQQTHTLAGHVYHRPHNLAPTTICIAACTRTQHSSHVMYAVEVMNYKAKAVFDYKPCRDIDLR